MSKKTFLISVLTISLFAPSTILLAGSVSSGGGTVFSDTWNPWFVQNTSNVTYCISKGNDFNNPDTELDQLVHTSLKFWQDELKNEFDLYGHGRNLRLGTQNFIKTNCDDIGVSLHFLFGNATDEQTKVIGDVRKHIGISIQTSYDEVYLKGKGFIYVSPDHGEKAYENAIDGTWSLNAGTRLKWLLVHELGHIFGLPHFQRTLMDREFPQDLVFGRKPTYDDRDYVPNVLTYKATYKKIKICSDLAAGKVLYDFFNIEKSTCIETWLSSDGTGAKFSKNQHLMGFFEMDHGSISPILTTRILITNKNRVIDIGSNSSKLLEGIGAWSRRSWGTIFDYAHAKAPMYLDLRPDEVLMTMPDSESSNMVNVMRHYP